VKKIFCLFFVLLGFRLGPLCNNTANLATFTDDEIITTILFYYHTLLTRLYRGPVAVVQWLLGIINKMKLLGSNSNTEERNDLY